MKKIAVGDLGEFWYGDYKEPFVQLEGAVPGYPQGTLLKDDEGKLLCAFCGKRTEQLGNHARKHGLTARDYKNEVGLLQKSALVSERVRLISKRTALRNRATGRVALSPALNGVNVTAAGQLGAAAHRRYTGVPEKLNKTGRCYAQMLTVGRQIAAEHGRVTERLLMQHGIRVRDVRRLFPSWETFLRVIGDPRPKSHGYRWSDSELLSVLKSLAIDLGQTPTGTDLRRYGLPDQSTYVDHFGSYTKACGLAGLPANLPSIVHARAFSTEEDVALLTAYAISGTFDRARETVGISHDRARQILAKYGIAALGPGNKHSDRLRQMDYAAEIARRLGGEAVA